MPSKRPRSSKMPDSAPNGEEKPILHKNPNPNPNPTTSKNPNLSPNPKVLKKSTPSNTTSKAPHPDSSVPDTASRKSHRKRKAKELPNEEEPCGGTVKNSHLQWAEEETLALLKEAVQFRSKTGRAPIRTDLGNLFDSIKDSLHAEITQEKIYNKLRSLRRKYAKTSALGYGPTPFDRQVHELSATAWGLEEENPNAVLEEKTNGHLQMEVDDEAEEDDGDEGLMEGGNGGDPYPCLAHELAEYWKINGLPTETLESGLKLINSAKAKALEEKWIQHLRGDLKLQMKTCDLKKELCALLLPAL